MKLGHLEETLLPQSLASQPSYASIPAGSTIQHPGRIKSGYAVTTYHQACICLLMPGDVVHPLLRAKPLSVRALGEVQLMPLSPEDIEASRQAAMTALARHTARCVAMPALERTADLFLEIAEKHPPEQDERIHFHLPITQDGLAQLLGVSAVHMNRIIKKLRELGALEIGHDHHAVLHRSRLAALL